MRSISSPWFALTFACFVFSWFSQRFLSVLFACYVAYLLLICATVLLV